MVVVEQMSASVEEPKRLTTVFQIQLRDFLTYFPDLKEHQTLDCDTIHLQKMGPSCFWIFGQKLRNT